MGENVSPSGSGRALIFLLAPLTILSNLLRARALSAAGTIAVGTTAAAAADAIAIVAATATAKMRRTRGGGPAVHTPPPRLYMLSIPATDEGICP